ncbi:MAG: adenylate/guanylate cyclase domain-containing protein [Verrucomicrobiaceae bacterium]|nr:MAG: adenylate/guanylate cyclase domain-containing protein [Verrucomicrobiaceae bacterium]
MALEIDLINSVAQTLRLAWTEREGRIVPEPESIGLGNDAVKIRAAVLYADMSGSTALVDSYSPRFAAEIYKCYLECAARIIKSEGGAITAYDGDRIMAVYLGEGKETSAARTGLKLNFAVQKIINPAIENQYPSLGYKMNHAVGVDVSELFVSRVGVRNDNDLTWVGRAANHAAKLSDLEDGYVFISKDIFDALEYPARYGGPENSMMWETRFWTAMDGRTIYRSNWWWRC